MNETVNLHLPQFEATDRIHHDDFNDAFDKIDTAVAAAGNCRIAIGSYVGTGEYGSSHKNSLTFDFEPQLIFMHAHSTLEFNNTPVYYIWANGAAECASEASGFRNTVTWNGNTVSWYCDDAGRQFNSNGRTYHYVAIG